jgi:hypothetical protein
MVYVGSGDKSLYALNASTGAKRWSFTAASAVVSSPAVANGIVYFASDDLQTGAGNVYALNATTGTKLWSYAASGPFVSSSPAVANGVVYVASMCGCALNALTGALVSTQTNFGNLITSSATVANGMVYVQSGDLVSPEFVFGFGLPGGADLFLRINPSTTTLHQGDLLTYAFPVWNLGPDIATHEVLNTQVPSGTTFDYIRVSGTPGQSTCTHPPFGGTGQIICRQNGGMAPNATWTVRLTVKVIAPSGTVITENAATMSDAPDPNLANNMATSSIKVQ